MPPLPECDLIAALRAIRTESAAALGYWFSISSKAVWPWRATFDVGGYSSTPTLKARRVASFKVAAPTKASDRTGGALDRMAKDAKKRAGRREGRWAPENGGWTAGEIELLGSHSDCAIARELGRTVDSVAIKRARLGLPKYRAGRAPPQR